MRQPSTSLSETEVITTDRAAGNEISLPTIVNDRLDAVFAEGDRPWSVIEP